MRTSGVVLVSFLTALITSLLTAVGTAYVLDRYDFVPKQVVEEKKTTVPELRGLTEPDARSSAGAAQLSLVISGREVSTEAKPGTVIRQSLASSQQVEPGQSISVVLADALPKVPEVAGLGIEEATKRLESAGYTVQVAGSVPDAKVPEGFIARQMPQGDSSYVKGAAVTIQLSSGPAEVEMPALVGQPYTKAKSDIEALGLKPIVAWISQGETPVYVILHQDPRAGVKLKPGSEVRFTVNQ